MNLNVVLEFGPNGRLFKNFQEFKALLTLNVCLTTISAFVMLSFLYYFLQFRRREGDKKYFNRKLISVTISLITVSMIFWALNFIFYYRASSVFSNATLAQNVIITCLAFGFATIFSAMGLIWFRVPYYGVIIDEDRFYFFGESLDFAKVTKIINDEKAKKLFINYSASVRTFKRYRLKTSSGVAQFLIANLPPVLTYESGDQETYFKELVKTLPSQEK